MNSAISLSLVFLGLMVFLAHLFASWYSKRMVPDVLFLMFIGLLIGPVFKIVNPADLGGFGSVFTTITLVIILFEGGTSLELSTLKTTWKSTMRLSFAGFISSTIVVAIIAYFFLDFSISSAIILGGILGGTSSAVVIPLVKQLKMGEESKTALILESAITDVLCIVVVMACIQTALQGEINFGFTFGSVLSSFTLASIMGTIGAMLWSRVLTRVRTLQNSILTTPAFVFVIFGTSEILGFSGAIAALAFGITIANADTFDGFIVRKIMGGEGHKLNDTELVFLREITFLLKTFFFVYIGISILFENVSAITTGLIISVTLYVLRLIIAKFASPNKASVFDKSIVSIMSPKGLAAAVLASIPEHAGIPEGTMIKNITYAVVLFTIIATAILIIVNNKSSKLQAFYEIIFNYRLKHNNTTTPPKDNQAIS